MTLYVYSASEAVYAYSSAVSAGRCLARVLEPAGREASHVDEDSTYTPTRCVRASDKIKKLAPRSFISAFTVPCDIPLLMRASSVIYRQRRETVAAVASGRGGGSAPLRCEKPPGLRGGRSRGVRSLPLANTRHRSLSSGKRDLEARARELEVQRRRRVTLRSFFFFFSPQICLVRVVWQPNVAVFSP